MQRQHSVNHDTRRRTAANVCPSAASVRPRAIPRPASAIRPTGGAAAARKRLLQELRCSAGGRRGAYPRWRTGVPSRARPRWGRHCMRPVEVLLRCGVVAIISGAPLVLSPRATAFPFGNCDQAEAAGATPIFAGQPGYSSDLDRDGDGVACEQGSGSVALRYPASSVPLRFLPPSIRPFHRPPARYYLGRLANTRRRFPGAARHASTPSYRTTANTAPNPLRPRRVFTVFPHRCAWSARRRRPNHGSGEVDRVLGATRLRRNAPRRKRRRFR